MTDKNDKKLSLFKKIGKSALKSTSSTVKGATIGTVTSSATNIAKDKLKTVAKSTGLTNKVDEKKGDLEKKVKEKENEMKKKIIKEGIKQSFKR